MILSMLTPMVTERLSALEMVAQEMFSVLLPEETLLLPIPGPMVPEGNYMGRT